MKLVLQYKNKGDKPEVVFSSNNNQEVVDKFDAVKKDSFSTEIWTLGMRQKAYYGDVKEVKKPIVKKVAKKKEPKVEEVD
jgi:hypothetical protein